MGISFNAAALLNGNGIDVKSVVSEIQGAQSGQLTVWQGDVTTLQTQATDISNINNDLSNLATAASGLTGANGALTAVTASSSETAIAYATATAGATAANYSVVVSGLATSGTLYTDEVATPTTSLLPAGQTTGNLSLQIGGASGTTADIAITKGSNDTLTTLAASINAQSASQKLGITATVLTDATGSRLAIYSQATGSSGALAISSGSGSNTTSLTFEPPVGGTDAIISVNGIPYASTTNTVTGAIPDVTLNLVSAAPATPVTIVVGPNSTAIASSINNFVTEYNTVVGDINAQFAINPSTGTQGPIGSDTYLRILQSSLGSVLDYATTDATSVSTGFTNLAAIGITANDDGTLSVNSSTLDSALTTNQAAVQNFFSNATSTGFADNLNTSLTNLTDPFSGLLNQDLASNQSQQNSLTTEITNFQTQLAAQKVQLDAEFYQVNSNLEQYPFTLQEINAALGSLTVGSTGSTGSTTNANSAPATGESVAGFSSASSSASGS